MHVTGALGIAGNVHRKHESWADVWPLAAAGQHRAGLLLSGLVDPLIRCSPVSWPHVVLRQAPAHLLRLALVL